MKILSKINGLFVKDLIINGTDREKSKFWMSIEGEVLEMVKSRLYKGMDPKEFISRVYEEMVEQIGYYDFTKYTFKSFMYFMVKNAVFNQRMEEDYTISMSKEMHALRCEAVKKSNEIQGLYGYEPSMEELADIMDEDPKKLSAVFVNDGMVDLDEPVDDEGDSIRKGDTIAAPDTEGLNCDEYHADLRRIMSYVVKKGIANANAANAFMALYAPENKLVYAPQIEDVAYAFGYKSAPALRYHLDNIVAFLNSNPKTRDLLGGFLETCA